jgi:hypothetical protein
MQVYFVIEENQCMIHIVCFSSFSSCHRPMEAALAARKAGLKPTTTTVRHLFGVGDSKQSSSVAASVIGGMCLFLFDGMI